MNTFLAIGLCGGACALLAMAGFPINKAAGNHRVVFEFVGEQPKQQESLLNNIENVLQALGTNTQILVVAHGGGLALLHQPEKAAAERMHNLAGPNVSFAACENTMRRQNLTQKDLVPFAVTVDSGVAEVVRRQAAGWRYIKSG